MPTPPDDLYLDALSAAVSALARGDSPAADQAVERLAVNLSPVLRRQSVSPTLAAQVMRRDFFTCLYCGGRIVPPPVLRAASLVWPRRLPYNLNWKTAATHPIYVSHAGTIDHIKALAHGGVDDAVDNLATACWACNLQKSEFSLERLGWELRRPTASGWDGLVGCYAALWQAAQRDASPAPADIRYHQRWLRAFELAT
jgi:5-methylcytosine-specific restriction endonuclease McrA